jgi:carbonic anhydrase
MEYSRPLPDYLVTRYRGWKATKYAADKSWFQHLARDGQHPRAMVISCCDSRLHVTSIFGADQGEFFIHRNIANLVPPFSPDGTYHGTSAAVEYAVTALKVAHLVVLGHSNCGGVRACLDMCAGNAPDLEQKSSFIGQWLDILRPKVALLPPKATAAARQAALERQSVLASLENLMTFPFVRDAVLSEGLTLHGVWHDIGAGALEVFDPLLDTFAEI